MLSEELYSCICGPPIAANTAVSKDIGIYAHTLSPSYTVKSTLKRSATPAHCLAISDSHVFAAQHEKSQVHVYSRSRGIQETVVTFPERIRSLALIDDVLALGTSEGRLILWETCTGRQLVTPPCHVQAVSCLAVTPYHILTGSEDSNIHVWTISRLLELDASVESEPDRTLANHRAAITSLAVSGSVNPETNICVSSSKDKTCIIWNYQTGDVLRTLLFSTAPLCVSMDPCGRAVFVSSEDRALYLVELFGEKPLIGPNSTESSSTVVQVNSPIGVADEDAGSALCLAPNHDGTTILSGHAKGKILQWQLAENGHPTELTDLNASVTNLVFPPLLKTPRPTKAVAVVKPTQTERQFTFTSQLNTSLEQETRFGKMLNGFGLPDDALEAAILSFQESHAQQCATDEEAQQETEELWDIINEQRALHKLAMQPYHEAKSSHT
ncbi:WD domain-containing protein [Colletotrichum abscissum]|uniref:Pre-rRNA-processing protein IPI3 n=1 Tax=Colletotrichum abscissum TaxID=1671311 RepID=A0A9Q0AW13_9PEZI|nr:WD domain-containing protein [Colletotrichum abscissum]KAI3530351.1 WD domain-containing protein [Colletotrichum abscissum]KAK1475871.1 WD domain-containing protein [Colletotrichum abscissum]